MVSDSKILIAHGNGGVKTGELIKELFFHYFNDPALIQQGDSAILPGPGSKMALTTDSFVIHPPKFPGGDIGKLAVCGTVNDLAVAGAEPLYLTAGFILEEGLAISELEEYVASMAQTAREAGIRIVTGDTKVVLKGQCDKLYINTTGIGGVSEDNKLISSGQNIIAGDKIIINGFIGDHGMAVYSERFPENIKSPVKSDCACLNGLIHEVLSQSTAIRFMRDPTRGGLAGVLNEITQLAGSGVILNEESIPIRPEVSGMCELLGFDPLYLANEGKVLMIVSPDEAAKVLNILRSHPLGQNAQTIGAVAPELKERVVMKTSYGGKRIIDPLVGDQLPRIC